MKAKPTIRAKEAVMKAKPTKRAKKQGATIVTSGWISSGEFAKAVNHGKTTVLTWAREKKVKTRMHDGDYLFRVEDAHRLNGGAPVMALPRAREHVPSIDDLDGAIAGRVFRQLAAGDRPEKIVCDLDIHPDTVEALFDRWRAFREGIYLDGAQVKAIRSAFIWRPFVDSADMVTKLCRVGKTYYCASCGESAGRYCDGCREAYAEARSNAGPCGTCRTAVSEEAEPYTEEEAARDREYLAFLRENYGGRKKRSARDAARPGPAGALGPEVDGSRTSGYDGGARTDVDELMKGGDPLGQPPPTSAEITAEIAEWNRRQEAFLVDLQASLAKSAQPVVTADEGSDGTSIPSRKVVASHSTSATRSEARSHEADRSTDDGSSGDAPP